MDFLTGVGLLSVVTVYFGFAFMLIFGKDTKLARKKFFRAVKSILKREPDDDVAISEIDIIFKKIAEKFSRISENHKNCADLLEDMYYRSESQKVQQKFFLSDLLYELIELSDDEKNRLVNIIKKVRDKQPYASVSSRYGNLMSSIQSSIETQNVELAKSNLRQLTDGVEVLETTIKTQDKRNRFSIIISIVGVILTIIFGALSLLPYIIGLIKGNQN